MRNLNPCSFQAAFAMALVCVGAVSSDVLAQDLDSINPILRSSLDSYFRTTEAIEVSNQLQIAKNELDRKVISNPKALMAGHVFMREGIASQGLVQMANRLKVDIAEVYARIPVGQRGVVWTFWRETPASNSLSQAERLALVEKSIRAAIFKLAAESVHSEDKEEGIALRTAPITYSAFVALGPARSVSNLRRELSEPHRLSRRLHTLRGWSHGNNIEAIFNRS